MISGSVLQKRGLAVPIYLSFVSVRWKNYLQSYQAYVVWVDQAAAVF